MAVSRWPLPLRLLLLTLLFVLPPAVLGGLALRPLEGRIGGPGIPFAIVGAIVGVQLGWTLLLALALRTERIVVGAHRASVAASQGLVRALDRALEGRGVGARPSLEIFADPRPSALAARALGGRGTILLSQGLVAAFSEAEIAEVLVRAIDRLEERGSVSRSLGAAINLILARMLPKAWTRIFFGGHSTIRGDVPARAFAFIWFIGMLPWLRLVSSLTGSSTSSPLRPVTVAWNSATRKMIDGTRVGGPYARLGSDPLYLVPPGEETALLPRGAPLMT